MKTSGPCARAAAFYHSRKSKGFERAKEEVGERKRWPNTKNRSAKMDNEPVVMIIA